MNQKQRQKLKKKCDALWSKVTKAEWKKHHGDMCAWCKIRPGEQSDHIINRWVHATRWDVSNMCFLCCGCHLFRKKRDPLGWSEMVSREVGEEVLNGLREKSKSIIHNQDYEKVYEYLKSFEETTCQ